MNNNDGLRQEILANIKNQHTTSLVILVLMLGLWIISKLETFHDAIFLIPILGIAWIFAMARADYLMHRIGAFLREQGDAWENWEKKTKHNLVLVLTDVGSALPILYLTAVGVTALWNEDKGVWASRAIAAFLLGFFLLLAVPVLFKKR